MVSGTRFLAELRCAAPDSATRGMGHGVERVPRKVRERDASRTDKCVVRASPVLRANPRSTAFSSRNVIMVTHNTAILTAK